LTQRIGKLLKEPHLGSTLRLWLGASFSAAGLIFALRNVNFAYVLDALGRTNYILVFLAVGTQFLVIGAIALRWRLLFPQRPRLAKLFSALLIAQLSNTVLPAKFGLLVRAYMLGEMETIDKAMVFSTVVVEKVFDALTLVFLFMVLIALVPLPAWLQSSGLVTSGAIFVILFPLMMLTAYQKDRMQRLVSQGLALVPGLGRLKLASHLNSILAALELLRQGRVNLALWGWTGLIWALGALVNYLVILAFGISVPSVAALFLLVVLQIGIRVPSSLGGIGVFQYLCVLALSVFSVDRSLALSYGFVLHFIVFVPGSILGAFYLWRENRDLQQLQAAVEANS
jgi:uncharacterized protein (TIRG00374 family)